MSKAPVIKASEAMRGTTFHVRFVLVRDWRFRLGLVVMKLGARLLGSRVKVTPEKHDAAPR